MKQRQITIFMEATIEVEVGEDHELEYLAEQLFNKYPSATELGWYALDLGFNTVAQEWAVTPEYFTDLRHQVERANFVPNLDGADPYLYCNCAQCTAKHRPPQTDDRHEQIAGMRRSHRNTTVSKQKPKQDRISNQPMGCYTS